MPDNIKVFKNPSELAEKLALNFMEFVKNKDIVNIALAGGSTPRLFYETLAKYASKVDWSNIHFYWGDERCVPPENKDSNYRMTKIALLDHIDIPKKNIHRILGENAPKDEALRYSAEISKNISSTEKFPSFDWILLGLGTDGHTASLFPDTDNLNNTEDLCVVAKHPESGQKRISFSLPLLQNAKRISFLVTGKNKTEIIHNLLEEKVASYSYPASLVYNKKLYPEWWLDDAAYYYVE